MLAYFQEIGAPYYHKMSHEGYLRHLLLRRAETTGEILVNLVTTSQKEYDLTPLTDQIRSLSLKGTIVGILHLINDSVADVVQSDETRILYGQDYFYETILGLRFKITPFSFFNHSSVRRYISSTGADGTISEIRGIRLFLTCIPVPVQLPRSLHPWQRKSLESRL